MRRAVLIIVLAPLALAAATALAGWCCYPEIRAEARGAPSFSVNQDQHAAHGYGTDSARVDSQITLRIPDGQADAVYQYLKGNYVGQDNILEEQFPDLHLSGEKMPDVSVFTDDYYDTPGLDLYRGKDSARHRQRVNTTDAKDRKNGRELVQMKVTPPGQFNLRTELKYEVKGSKKRKSKAGGKSKTRTRTRINDDSHPLVRLIAHAQREDFKRVYTDANINPYSLRHVFTIQQTRSRGYLDLDEKNIFSFSVDEGSAEMLWAKGSFSSVDLGLVEIAYTEADEARRKQMWAIRDAIIKDLEQHFPGLTENSDSKYSIVLDQLMRKIPLIPALLRFQLL